VIIDAARVLGDVPVAGARVLGLVMIVVSREDNGARCTRDNRRGVPAAIGLATHVGHLASHAPLEPLGQSALVRDGTQVRHAGRMKTQVERLLLHLGRAALRGQPRIRWRRQRANRSTSLIGGTALSSPYAVYIRHRTYSRGGVGMNGKCRYQSEARKAQASAIKSTATRGFAMARTIKRRLNVNQLAGELRSWIR